MRQIDAHLMVDISNEQRRLYDIQDQNLAALKGEYVDENLQQLNLSDYLEQKSSDSDSINSNYS